MRRIKSRGTDILAGRSGDCGRIYSQCEVLGRSPGRLAPARSRSCWFPASMSPHGRRPRAEGACALPRRYYSKIAELYQTFWNHPLPMATRHQTRFREGCMPRRPNITIQHPVDQFYSRSASAPSGQAYDRILQSIVCLAAAYIKVRSLDLDSAVALLSSASQSGAKEQPSLTIGLAADGAIAIPSAENTYPGQSIDI